MSLDIENGRKIGKISTAYSLGAGTLQTLAFGVAWRMRRQYHLFLMPWISSLRRQPCFFEFFKIFDIHFSVACFGCKEWSNTIEGNVENVFWLVAYCVEFPSMWQNSIQTHFCKNVEQKETFVWQIFSNPRGFINVIMIWLRGRENISLVAPIRWAFSTSLSTVRRDTSEWWALVRRLFENFSHSSM